MTNVSRIVRVTGRVQGVFYRSWAKTEADRLGIRGWVRNRQDGSVEAHLEGNEVAVDRMIRLMRDGPRQAQVLTVEATPASTDHSIGFEIRR